MSAPSNTSHSLSFRITQTMTAVAFVALVTLIFLEFCARLVYSFRDDLWRLPFTSAMIEASVDLDAFEKLVPSKGRHWTLVPGYNQSIDEQLPGTYLVINRDGYKGAEITKPKNRPRVLTLGDSVTFGRINIEYQDAMRRRLAAEHIDVEVINGGVEGYRAHNLIAELDRYRVLKPDITTLMIGWNDIFGTNPDPAALRITWLIETGLAGWQRLLGRGEAQALALYNREWNVDPDDPLLINLNAYVPTYIGDVAALAAAIRNMGSKVVLITLPGLYRAPSDITAEALAKGHLPQYTTNALVLAKLTERYNIAIRDLAVRENYKLLDVAVWSDTALSPRPEYFSDSVHLTNAGLDKLGDFIGDAIVTLLNPND